MHIKIYKSSYCPGFETKTVEAQNYWGLKRLLVNLLFKKSHLGSWVSVVRTMFRWLFNNSKEGNSTNSCFQSPLQCKGPFLIFRHLFDLKYNPFSNIPLYIASKRMHLHCWLSSDSHHNDCELLLSKNPCLSLY